MISLSCHGAVWPGVEIMIILWPAQYDGSVFYVFTNPTILSGDDLSSSLVGMVKTFLRLLNQQIFTLARLCLYLSVSISRVSCS